MLARSASKVERSLLSNYPKRPALILAARGAPPSMRERRVNSCYDASVHMQVASLFCIARPHRDKMSTKRVSPRDDYPVIGAATD